MRDPNILIVEYHDDIRRRWSEWLEAGGFDVMECPGPREPEYVCMAGRGDGCPLAHGADIVIIDMKLASDQALEGTPSWQLVLHYLESGCDVIAVTDNSVLLRWLQDERVLAIPDPQDAEDLLRAVRACVVDLDRQPA